MSVPTAAVTLVKPKSAMEERKEEFLRPSAGRRSPSPALPVESVPLLKRFRIFWVKGKRKKTLVTPT